DQNEVDAIVTSLQNLKEALVKVDREKLKELTIEAENLNTKGYTDESVNALNKALDIAKETKVSQNQEVIDEAVENLRKAINGLVEPSYEALQDAIKKAESLDLTLYTSESIKTLTQAIESSKYNLHSTSQKAIDTSTETLNSIIDTLVELEST